MSEEQQGSKEQGVSAASDSESGGGAIDRLGQLDSDTHEGDLVEDEWVRARWQLTVVPDESVSVAFSVWPKNRTDRVTSVNVSFDQVVDGMVKHSFCGASGNGLLESREGQGLTGDLGVDVAVFRRVPAEQLHAILAGTVRRGEETENYYFSRQFNPDE